MPGEEVSVYIYSPISKCHYQRGSLMSQVSCDRQADNMWTGWVSDASHWENVSRSLRRHRVPKGSQGSGGGTAIGPHASLVQDLKINLNRKNFSFVLQHWVLELSITRSYHLSPDFIYRKKKSLLNTSPAWCHRTWCGVYHTKAVRAHLNDLF